MIVTKLLVSLAVLASLAGPAIAQQRGWGPSTNEAGGHPIPYARLKAMTDRAVGGRLIGSDYDPDSWTYQMRYMRGTDIIDVVVDARSGKILGRRESM